MKKTLILLLTVFALVSVFTITAFAAEAKIGETEYDTLAEAIAAANDGDVVELLTDVTVASPIVIDKPLTLNGNSFKITATNNTVDCRAINVKTEGEVKIEYLTVEAYGERAINVIQKPATLTISNVTAIAGNYALNVAGTSVGSTILVEDSYLSGLSAVNISGTDTSVEIYDSVIICNDNTDAEAYGAITVGSAVSNVTVNVYGGEVVVNGDSAAVANFSSSSTVTFEGTIGVDKTIDVVAMIGLAGFETLAGAIEYATNGQTVTLVKDVTLDKMIQITKAITIDLNGNKVTATCQKAIEVYTDATIKNGTIEAVQRCVDTRKAVNLVLEDLTLVADKYVNNANPQPLTIGGSTNGTVVTMNNVNISAKAGYCIIAFVETDLTATNCELKGYNSLYTKSGSEGSEFTFVNSTLEGSTAGNDVAGNATAAILVQSNNITVNADEKSTIKANGKYAYAFALGTNYKVSPTVVTNVNINVSSVIDGNVLVSNKMESNTVVVPSEYAEKLAENGFVFAENEDGTVTATKKAIAKVGNKNFATLSEAFQYANAQGGAQEIVLLSNTTLAGVDVNNVTLDLNGYTVTSTDSYFFLLQGGSLKVVDTSAEKTGKLNGVTTGNAFIMYGNGSSLTLDGVSVLSNNNVLFTYYSNNTVSIKDSNLESVIDTGNIFYLCSYETTLTIDGGKYDCYNSANSNVFADFVGTSIVVTAGSFARDVSAYCDNGYSCEYNAETGYYEVTEATSESYVAMIENVGYTSLSAAMKAAGPNDTIVILCDITEDMAIINGNLVCGNENGVTITNTIYDAWAYSFDGFVLGENITYITTNEGGICVYGSNCVINGTAILEGYYQIGAGSKLTINAPGSLTVTTETFIISGLENDAKAGIYVNGDNNSETKEINASVIYFYQGTISAKNAEIVTAVYWQTQTTNNQATATLVLDNSSLTVWDGESNAQATGDTAIVLKNGSTMSVATALIAPSTEFKVDATSKITVKNASASQVPSYCKLEANEEGGYTLKVSVRISDVFSYKGTSTFEDRLTAGYSVNHEKLAVYMAENGINTVEFGGVMAIESIVYGALEFGFTKYLKTPNYNIILNEVTEEYYDLGLILTMYVSFDGNEKQYVNAESELVKASEIVALSYNDIKSKEDAE